MTPESACLTAQGQIFSLMKRHIGGEILYRGKDALATARNGVITVTAVNRDYEKSERILIAHTGRITEARLFAGDTVIPPSWFEEREMETAGDVCVLPPRSVMMVSLQGF